MTPLERELFAVLDDLLADVKLNRDPEFCEHCITETPKNSKSVKHSTHCSILVADRLLNRLVEEYNAEEDK